MSFSSWITKLFSKPIKAKTQKFIPLRLQPLEDRVTPALPFSTAFPTAISIVTSTGSSGAPANGTAAFTVSFSDNVTGVDASDFSTVATGTVSGGFLTVSGSGKTYTVTAQSVTGNGTLGLNLNSNASISAIPSFAPQATFGVGFGSASSVTMGDVNGDKNLDIITANSSSNNVGVLLGDGKGSFGPQTAFASGNKPNSATLGDVNGDGNLDIVTRAGTGGTASVLLGDGKGSFGVPTTFATGNFPNSLALGDVNGDGNLDIVTISNFNPLNSGANISVLLGDGKGAFAAPTTSVGTYGGSSVTLGDVNGDNKLDIVIVNNNFGIGNGGVGVFLGNGNGTFGAPTGFVVENSPQSLVLGDVNGDNKLDIVTANYGSNNASVLLGDGKGSFGPQATFAVGDKPKSVKLGDVNGDNNLDIVTANGSTFGISNSGSVLLGDGKGSFGSQTTFAVGDNPNSLALGDVDGNSKLDIVTANDDNTLSLLLGNGNGTFANQAVIGPGVTGPRSMTLGDVNGDGKDDIITVNGRSNNASLFLGNGNGAFATQNTFFVGEGPSSVTLGDVNGDGKLDIVTSSSVLLGNGNGTFAAPTTFAGGGGFVDLGDINADGKLDIVISGSVLLGKGDGSFGAPITFQGGSSGFNFIRSLSLGDVNADGKLDIVTVSNFDSSVLLGNGNGTFATPATFAFAVIGFPSSMALGDVNGDGKLDILTANGSYGAKLGSVLLGNGNGSFGTQTTFAVGDPPSSISLGDVNGDGKVDIVTANNPYQSNCSASVLLGNGNGTFAALANFAVGEGPFSVKLGDVNGDGRLDIITGNYDSNSVSVLLGNNSSAPSVQFAPQATFGVGVGGPNAVALGDVNGDGNSDIVTVIGSSNCASVFLAIGDGSFANQTTFAVGDNPNSLALGDVNGDSKLDIVTANSSKTVSVLLGDGNGTFASQQTFLVSDDIFARPEVVTLGDVNGDNKLDIVTATRFFSSGAASVLLGNGNGSFGTATTFGAGGGLFSFTSLTLGDVNEDNNLDIVNGSSGNSSVNILLGNGNGAFQAQTTFSVGNFAQPFSVSPRPALGDVNKDNNLDIVTANGNGSASVLLGNGNGTFGTATTFALVDSASLTLGDVNNDNNLDIVASNANQLGISSNTASVLLGNGTGSFGTPTTFAVGGASSFLTLGKVNGDGNLDIVTANTISNTVSLLLGNGNGAFANPATFGPGVGGLSSLSSGDVNGDGRVDIVTANSGSDNASVFLGNGNGTFAAQITFAVGDGPGVVELGDVNGDGRLDLVTTNGYSKNASILLGNGNGTFAPQTTFAVGDNPSNVKLGDVNSDGKLDLVNTDGKTVSVLLGNGNGTFGNRTTSTFGNGPGPVTLGDVNGDGKLDIVSTISYGAGILLGKGDGTFVAQPTFSTIGRPSSVALGDVNGDGKLDIAIGTGFGIEVSVFLGNGDGTVATRTAFQADFSPFSVTLGDVNGDGKLDIATPGFNNTISLLLGNGNGTFATKVTFATEGSVRDMVVSDVNSDGRLDIITANSSSNSVSVLLNSIAFTGQTFNITNIPPTITSDDNAKFTIGKAGSFTVTATGTPTPTITATVQFAPAANFGPGTGAPSSMALGDVNKDNIPDIVTINSGSSNVSVLLGDGKGGFGPQSTFFVDKFSGIVALGDVNGDGNLDIVTAGSSGSGTTSVLLGDGKGAFGAQTTFATGNFPNSLTLGDVNGDGNLDIVTVSFFQGGRVLLGDGKGAFAAPTTFAGNYGVRSVTFGDVNGDSKLDIVNLNGNFTGSGNAGVLLGDGKGSFGPQVTFEVGVNPNSLALGDINGDGNLDIVTANSGFNNASVLLGDGKGSFGPQVTFEVGGTPFSVKLGDVNKDNNLDIVTANSTFSSGSGSGSASVLLGDGKGAFGPQTTFVVGAGPVSVSLGDVNSDGNLDIVTANGDNTESILLGDGKGAFGPQTAFGPGVSGVSSVTMGDFNGDGKVDIVTLNRQSVNASLFLGLGNGAFAEQTPFAVGSQPGSLSVGDVNLDGKLDMVITNSGINGGSSTASVYLGNGNGTFAPLAPFAANASLTLGDVNGDGKLDIVTGGGFGVDSAFKVFLGNGNGTFGAPTTFASGFTFGSSPSFVTLGDVNGDKMLDIVAANFVGLGLSVLLGKGDGTFGLPATFSANSFPNFLTLGDVNSDGKLDIVTGSGIFGGSNVNIFLGNGDGSFGDPAFVAVEGNPSSVTLGDINGDGKLDLVTANSGYLSGSSSSVLLGNGDGTFTPPTTIAVGGCPRSVALSDVNGDGKLDIVTGNYNNNTVSVLLGNNSSAPTGTLPAGLTLSSAGSITGTPTQVGTFNFTIIAANGVSPNATQSFTLTVTAATTTTGLTSSTDPSVVGESISFTAAVSAIDEAAGIPTGTVTFFNGTKELGSSNLNIGFAALSVDNLPLGTSSITAVYNGNDNFLTSTSSPLPQTVTKATSTIALTSSVNPSALGQSTTLSATVASGCTCAPGTPTGLVIFKNGADTLGSVILNGSGVASLSLATLPVGNLTVSAEYSGDSKFDSNTGFATQTVSPFGTATALSLTTSASDAVAGKAFGVQPVITIKDAFGNTVGNSTAGVTLSASTGPTLIGTTTVNAVNGIATFTNAGLDGNVGTYTLTYSSGSLTQGVQSVLLESAVSPVVVGTTGGSSQGSTVTIVDPATGQSSTVVPFPGFTGEVRVAAGDINGDGKMETIAAAGAGGGPAVNIIDSTGKTTAAFFAFDPAFAGGVFIAVSDVNNDGFADIIAGAGEGGGPHVKIFNGKDLSELGSFFAYAEDFKGGVSVASADINGDGTLDVVTGAGPGGGPHVKVFDGKSNSLISQWFAYAPDFTGGVFVGIGDIGNDGKFEVVTGAGEGGGPVVAVFDPFTGALQAQFFAYGESFTGGVRVGVSDGNGDSVADLVTGAGPGGGPHVKGFNFPALDLLFEFFSGPADDTGGVFVN